MAQDIRDLLKQHDSQEQANLSPGHEKKFEALLDQAMPQKAKPTFVLWKVAAVLVVALGIGYMLLTNVGLQPEQQLAEENVVPATENQINKKQEIRLGDISPDLKKLEQYYTSNITMGLASLDITPENQELIDGYLDRLAELNNEYKRLNAELNTDGPNEATVTALIDNLKIRLELLFKLKSKLNELKTQNNETISNELS